MNGTKIGIKRVGSLRPGDTVSISDLPWAGTGWRAFEDAVVLRPWDGREIVFAAYDDRRGECYRWPVYEFEGRLASSSSAIPVRIVRTGSLGVSDVVVETAAVLVDRFCGSLSELFEVAAALEVVGS